MKVACIAISHFVDGSIAINTHLHPFEFLTVSFFDGQDEALLWDLLRLNIGRLDLEVANKLVNNIL